MDLSDVLRNRIAFEDLKAELEPHLKEYVDESLHQGLAISLQDFGIYLVEVTNANR